MRILSVDYGEARTGLAVSDYTGTIASPLTVIHEKNMDTLVSKISDAVKENDIFEIVVGNPINMNGSIGEKSLKCESLSEKLREITKVPVVMWDERLTTVAAHKVMNDNNKRGKKRRESIDAVAAAVILEGYLWSKNKKK